MSTRHRATACPRCEHTLVDASTSALGVRPEPGDTSVCAYCGQVLKYEDDLAIRKATVAEIRELMENAEAWAAIERAQRLIQQRERRPA